MQSTPPRGVAMTPGTLRAPFLCTRGTVLRQPTHSAVHGTRGGFGPGPLSAHRATSSHPPGKSPVDTPAAGVAPVAAVYRVHLAPALVRTVNMSACPQPVIAGL